MNRCPRWQATRAPTLGRRRCRRLLYCLLATRPAGRTPARSALPSTCCALCAVTPRYRQRPAAATTRAKPAAWMPPGPGETPRHRAPSRSSLHACTLHADPHRAPPVSTCSLHVTTPQRTVAAAGCGAISPAAAGCLPGHRRHLGHHDADRCRKRPLPGSAQNVQRGTERSGCGPC